MLYVEVGSAPVTHLENRWVAQRPRREFSKHPAKRRAVQVCIAAGAGARGKVPKFSGVPTFGYRYRYNV